MTQKRPARPAIYVCKRCGIDVLVLRVGPHKYCEACKKAVQREQSKHAHELLKLKRHRV